MNAKLILIVAASAALLVSPAESYGAVTNIEEEVRHTLLVMNPDVRKKWLVSLRDSSGLTDDEFSALLVKTANEAEQEHNADLRFFTMAAIKNFGTTNALEFLENEVARGPDFAGGLRGYSIITGFDDRCFDLLQKIVADESDGNHRRRSDVYRLLDYVLTPGADHLTRCVNTNDLANVRQRAQSFLLDATHKEKKYNRVYLDQILTEHLPGYRYSTERHAIIMELKDSNVPTPYIGSYFRNELQKLEAEEAQVSATNAPPLATASAGRGEGHPDYSRPVVIFSAVAVGIVGALVFVRKRRGK